MKYRAEIDGLRALAVVPVILFHAGFELFSGGFVGVDVFFVISGYLITTILIEDIANDRFSLVKFYERRARRILPALFFVMLVCIPFAWMWMLPNQIKDFSQSIIAVSLFASNILFWKESDYFDASAEEKPLLHTWSLAVEEQYYLLFPIFLLLVWRFGRNRVFWMIVVMAAISLMLSEWGWRNRPTANFYLAPTRAWELFAGSIAAFIVQKRGVQSNNLLSLLGLTAVVFAIFAYDETTPFPSLYTMVPVVGVVLLVLFANQETFVARLLSTKAFVGIGLISYSAYLWHQPLFAFARIKLLEHPSQYLMGFLSLASIVLAVGSWRYIEKPFRDSSRVNRKTVFTVSAVFAVAFISLGLAPNIYDFHSKTAVAINDATIERERKFRFSSKSEICKTKFWGNCNDAEIGKRNVLVIGDSHSADALNAVYHATTEFHSELSFSTSNLGGCAALINTRDRLPNTWPNKKKCVLLNESERFDEKFLNQYDVVILNFLLGGNFTIADYKTYLDYLQKNYRGEILLFGGAFFFQEELPSFFNKGHDVSEIEKIVKFSPQESDEILRSYSASNGIIFMSKYDVFCPEGICSFVSESGILMSYDKHHLSVHFANMLGEHYRQVLLTATTGNSID
ncbi:MAG: acyltransferase family protein [Pseudomonadota bacterium]